MDISLMLLQEDFLLYKQGQLKWRYILTLRDFFVPESFNKTKINQEKLQADDARTLRQKLGVEDITEIMPEVPEVTEVVFEHYDKTGVRLTGMDFRYLYVRTNTPTNKSGFFVAHVGNFDAYGPSVSGWGVDDGRLCVGAARWVVPSQVEI